MQYSSKEEMREAINKLNKCEFKRRELRVKKAVEAKRLEKKEKKRAEKRLNKEEYQKKKRAVDSDEEQEAEFAKKASAKNKEGTENVSLLPHVIM